jgi:hypothetical protein
VKRLLELTIRFKLLEVGSHPRCAHWFALLKAAVGYKALDLPRIRLVLQVSVAPPDDTVEYETFFGIFGPGAHAWLNCDLVSLGDLMFEPV